jgi:DNA-binding PadR family transcriptional regulator
MGLPEITHLQFLILQILGGLERSGKYIREQLEEYGEEKSLPAFYQAMSRLEDAGLVSGSARKVEIEGLQLTERWYKVTIAGERARRAAIEFYAQHAGKAKGATHA